MKLSVIVVTYNQEKYITQALDSVLKQDMSLIQEIIIADDGSSDNTLSVCKEYQTKYPNLIKIIKNDEPKPKNKNLHPDIKNEMIRKNYIRGINACSDTDYIAMLEGDDYWLDGKLKFVADVIEQNKQDKYSMYFHKYDLLNNGEITQRYYKYEDTTDVDVEECITDYQIQNLSCCVYNTSILKSICNEFENVTGVDYSLNILVTMHSPALFIPKVLSIYRLNDNGSWSALPEELKQVKGIYRRVELKYLMDEKLQKYFDKSILMSTEYFLDFLQKEGRLSDFPYKKRKKDKESLYSTKKNSKLFSVTFNSQNDKGHCEITVLGIKLKFKMEKE